MLEKIFNQDTIIYVIAGICGVGVVTNLLMSFLYSRLVKDAKNLVSPRTKFMKNMKSGFESQYRMNEGVNNISAFIDKWMERYKILGLDVHKFRRISSYAMMISLLLGVGVGSYLPYKNEMELALSLPYYGAGIASFLILFSVRMIADLSYKRQTIVLHATEFFENSMANRLSREIRIDQEVERLKAEKETAELKTAKEAKNQNHRERIQPEYHREVAAAKAMEEGEIQQESSNLVDEERAITLKEAKRIPIREIQTIKPVPLKVVKPMQGKSKKIFDAGTSRNKEKLSKREVDENVARMRESMSQIAAGNAEQRSKNREILKSMNQEEQEEVIRSILKEYLS